PAERLPAALDLLAEMVLHPVFPEREVERLRDERLNDLLQARADPRRRADEAFVETIYADSSPYHRPGGGVRETVERLDPQILRTTYERSLDPAGAAFVVGGDLRGLDPLRELDRLFGGWTGKSGDGVATSTIDDRAARPDRIVRVIHRPGSVQTEIRIGHRALSRRIPDFHALTVMSAILGGLFNSRLNMKLREEKGYTYGAGAGFDLRRAAGPFAARAAVNTEVTVPAVEETMAELRRMRDSSVGDEELAAARDFLVGVFPLRFETAGAVVGSIAGLVVHGLPLDEIVRYRDAIEAVTIDQVRAAATAHLHVDEAAIVLVGDADAFGAALESSGLGPIVIERDEAPAAPGPIPGEEELASPVDEDDDTGPTAGTEDPELPGSAGPAEPGTSNDASIAPTD
ncbi:MAG: M16 family metallopeptidase, partial [Chloroflexota bacterium]